MKLIDACEFIVDCPHSSAKDEGVGIALIRTPNVGKGRLVLDNVHRVSEAVYQERIARAVPTSGDLILAREAPVGNVAIIQEGQKVCLGQRVVLIRCNQSIAVPDFLVYYLLSAPIQHKLLNQSNETTVAHLNVANIRNLEIDLPPISIQRRIAAILSSLDRKIELNNTINAQLEEMAQAIFKNWFVDFEPFKDGKFVDSELGRIPKGWRVGTLFDVAEIYDKKRKPLSGNERDKMQKIYPYYGATSCMDYVDDYLFDGIYTLIGEDGSVVKENGLPFMQYVWGKIWVNNHAHILQGKNGYNTEMIHCLLSQTNINHLVTGAVQAKLSQGNMQKIVIAIPPMSVLDSVRPIFESIYTQYRNKTEESLHLAHLRDTLLPKLMSGEIELGPSIEEQLKIIDEMFAELEPVTKRQTI